MKQASMIHLIVCVYVLYVWAESVLSHMLGIIVLLVSSIDAAYK